MADRATAMVGNNKNVRNERQRQRRGKMNKSIFIIDKMREREKKWDLWNKTSLAAIFTPLYAYRGVTGHHIRGMTKTMMNYIPPTTNQNTEFNTLVCDWSNARSFSLIKKIAVFFAASVIITTVSVPRSFRFHFTLGRWNEEIRRREKWVLK